MTKYLYPVLEQCPECLQHNTVDYWLTHAECEYCGKISLQSERNIEHVRVSHESYMHLIRSSNTREPWMKDDFDFDETMQITCKPRVKL